MCFCVCVCVSYTLLQYFAEGDPFADAISTLNSLPYDVVPIDLLYTLRRTMQLTLDCLKRLQSVAKGLAAAQHCDVAFRDGHVQKTYVAVVHGVPNAASFVVAAVSAAALNHRIAGSVSATSHSSRPCAIWASASSGG